MSDAPLIKDKIETLIKDTNQRHKGAYIYFCSLSPMNNQKASDVNAHILNITKNDYRVRYMNTSNILKRDNIHPTYLIND